MHTRTTILLQTSAAIAAMILTYVMLAHSTARSNHRNNAVLVFKNDRVIDLAQLIGCKTLPTIQLIVFSKELKHTRRLVQSLSSAAHGSANVHLTVYGERGFAQETAWNIGDYNFTTQPLSQLRNQTDVTVVVIEDHAQPSPFYALWFLMQSCAHPNASVSGGGGLHDIAGLGMSARAWNGYIRWAEHVAPANASIQSIVNYISRQPNATIIFPSIKDNNVFMRSAWQNPVYVEKPPTLVRAWDALRDPIWGAVEIVAGPAEEP